MSEQELQNKILDYILTLYKSEYTGYLKVEKTQESGDEYFTYIFYIGLPSYMQPTSIGYHGEDEGFLNLIEKELRIRNYMRVYFYKINRDNGNERR